MDSRASQSISDDQELAKVLAGVSQDTDNNLQFEETSNIVEPTINPATISPDPVVTPQDDNQVAIEPAVTPIINPTPTSSTVAPADSTTDPALDNIKQTALSELRPLVDKLDVSPEEKFDTYLLLIRSTDDKSLIAPAHDAAVAIIDEARRAQALLDIIKEIDYLSNPR
jgi:bifunctional phosphoglucose/phosphomannose isomerase